MRFGDTEVSLLKCFVVGIGIFILSGVTGFIITGNDHNLSYWYGMLSTAYLIIALILVIHFKKFGVIKKIGG